MEILWLWVYIIISSFLQYQTGISLYDYSTTKPPLCLQEQKQFLLQLKQQLSPSKHYLTLYGCPELPKNYYKTMFWNQSSDCCLWDGVTCDVLGRVIGLDLSCGGLTGEIHSSKTLFRLSHLRKLNLAFNYFMGSKISSEFGQLNGLTHLNLSHSYFEGQIPMKFYHLSNLVMLDLSKNWDLNCDIKMLLGNMTRIRVLVLGGVNISSEMPMNMSSFLTHLDLSFTGLQGKLPVTIFEKPDLQVLRLRENQGLEGSLPESIGSLTNLNYMDISACKFWGPIPESIGNITGLTYIGLSRNEFNGQLPSTISNLRQLTHLDLSSNHLQGQLPDAFSNLQKLTRLILSSNYFLGLIPSSFTNMSQLEKLDISSNALKGQIPSSLTNMSQLDWLDISSNALTGPFPSRAGHGIQKLRYMDLSNNSIKGMIPSWLLSLPSLERLDLSFNRLTGLAGKFNSENLTYLDLSNNQFKIELESFDNLSNIQSLLISFNTVTSHAHQIANVTFPSLERLGLSSCEINEFPDFLRYLPNINFLDLSNNKIRGPIPSWFSSLPWQDLSYLNLSTNYLTYAGHLPWQDLQVLDLHSNSLQGTFPSYICKMSRLSILNLSNNKLKGKIPECIGNFSASLSVLDLRRNQLNGKIPKTIGGAVELGNLGLNENHLKGPLPRSLANCTELEVLDLGNNMIQDTFPWWLDTLPRLKILILRSNRFHGSIRPPFSNNSFNELRIIDLSYNNFDGLLPEKLFARLQAIRNMDQVSTHGPMAIHDGRIYQQRPCNYENSCSRGDNSEPDLLGYQYSVILGYQYSVILSVKGANVELTRELRILTTIDLSNNEFQGHIPESITYLYSLRLVNLSHNNINGSIPPALGQMTNLEQLDLSSNQLTGGIPQTLTNLTFLSVLNLSHNYLVGSIPQVNQFPTFSNDSYIGNLGLCGAPLTKNCGDAPPPVLSEEEDDDDFGFMMGFTWKAVVMGHGCGIVFGFILGNVMISTRKPKCLARFVKEEAAIILHRRKKRGRIVQGRR